MEKVGVASARKSLKRKLEEEFEEDGRLDALSQPHALRELVREVGVHVSVLNSAISSSEADRSAAKRAVHVLTELAKNGDEPLDYFSIRVVRVWCRLVSEKTEGKGGKRKFNFSGCFVLILL